MFHRLGFIHDDVFLGVAGTVVVLVILAAVAIITHQIRRRG
jgi:hypothetical protein